MNKAFINAVAARLSARTYNKDTSNKTRLTKHTRNRLTEQTKKIIKKSVDKDLIMCYTKDTKNKRGDTTMMQYYKDSNTKPLAWTATALFILLVVCVIWFATMNQTNTYTMECYVAEIDTDNNLVVLVDHETENEWVWEGIENLNLFDEVKLTMNDNGTQDVTDDVILTLDRAC